MIVRPSFDFDGVAAGALLGAPTMSVSAAARTATKRCVGAEEACGWFTGRSIDGSRWEGILTTLPNADANAVCSLRAVLLSTCQRLNQLIVAVEGLQAFDEVVIG